MANELSASFSITVNKGTFSETKSVSFTRDITAAPADVLTKNYAVTDSAANIDTTGLTTPSYGIVRNLGDTNDLLIGVDATGFQEVLRIPAGEALPIRVGSSVTLQVKCDSTETTDAQVSIFDD